MARGPYRPTSGLSTGAARLSVSRDRARSNSGTPRPPHEEDEDRAGDEAADMRPPGELSSLGLATRIE